MSRLRRLVPRRLKRLVRTQQQRAQVRAIHRAHARSKPPVPAHLLPTALVIPVHNDALRLTRLLDVANDMGFAEIIVVDDGSDTPVIAEHVTLIRHNAPLGPGPARSAGLARVTAPYTLFIDSDDLPTPDLALLLADLATATPFDFCLFKHIDSRIANQGHWGQPEGDEMHWQAAGLAIGALRDAPSAVWSDLAQTTNYPWNKVYRTAFLTDHDIRCADVTVHEDIALHWLSFFHAARVLTSDRTCVWHLIDPDAARQSNRSGAERLGLFDALAPVVAADPAPAMCVAFVRFVLALTTWARTVMDAEHLPAFDAALIQWLTQTVQHWHDDIAAADPALLARITKQT
ncbi:MAG: hypothetical protein ACJA1J_001770 [Sulfitobacter pontiacus]|jgi:hypothetical protein